MVNTRSAAGLAEDTNNTGFTMRADPPSASGSGGVVAETPPAGPPIIPDSQGGPPPAGPHNANDQFWNDDSFYELFTRTPDNFDDKNQPMNNAEDAPYDVTMNVVEDDNQARMDEEIA